MKPGGGTLPGPALPGPGMKGGGGMPAVGDALGDCVCGLFLSFFRGGGGNGLGDDEWGRKRGIGPRTREAERGRRKALPAHRWRTALRSEHGIGTGLAFGGVGGCDGVDDRLGFFVADFCNWNVSLGLFG